MSDDLDARGAGLPAEAHAFPDSATIRRVTARDLATLPAARRALPYGPPPKSGGRAPVRAIGDAWPDPAGIGTAASVLKAPRKNVDRRRFLSPSLPEQLFTYHKNKGILFI